MLIERRRIVQILPAPADSYALFLDSTPGGCSVSPVVCLALVDRWESNRDDEPVPDYATRSVLAMVAVEGMIEIPDGAAVNYEGYYTQAEALKLLHARLSELCHVPAGA